MTNTAPIEKIKKLLDLSKNAGSDAEAANAATRAAELMAKFDIDEATVAIETGQARVAEPIVTAAMHVDEDKVALRRSAWRGIIAYAVALSYGCRMYWTGGVVKIYGRTSATQAVMYTTRFLWNEVERLADDAWAQTGLAPSKSTTKTWKNAFRVGAASAIANRMNASREAQEAAKIIVTEVDAPATSQLQALMIIDREAEEVETGYQEIAKTFRRGGQIGKTRRRDAYRAGQDAGNGMALGEGRAQLKRGTETFKP